MLLNEYDKCRFCCWYDTFDGCTNDFCNNKRDFKANKDRMLEKAKENGISVLEVIALIDMEN